MMTDILGLPPKRTEAEEAELQERYAANRKAKGRMQYVREDDAAKQEPPGPTPALKEWALEAGWDEAKDGPVVGIFMSRPRGQRAIWSVRWAIGGNQRYLTPQDLVPFPPGGQYLRAEFDDAVFSGLFTSKYYYELCDKPDWTEGEEELALDIVRQAREQRMINEYCAPFGPPAKIYDNRVRPGWDKAKSLPIAGLFKTDADLTPAERTQKHLDAIKGI